MHWGCAASARAIATARLYPVDKSAGYESRAVPDVHHLQQTFDYIFFVLRVVIFALLERKQNIFRHGQ